MNRSHNLTQNGIAILNSNRYNNMNNLQNSINPSMSPLPLDSLPLNNQFQEIIDKHKLTSKKAKKKTDDQIFAQSEISELNTRLEKNRMKGVKVWDKSSQKGDSVISSLNNSQIFISQVEPEVNIRKKISEIKKTVKEKGSGGGFSSLAEIPNMNSYSNSSTKGKHFNKMHLEVISESSRILKEKSLQNSRVNIPGKIDSIHNFINDNREISMKNYILNLLKTERAKILTKEGEVFKALKDSEVKLEDDFKTFENFTDLERSQQREMDKNFIERLKDNRDLADRKKKLYQENKQIVDELERTVKAIKTYKSDAVFVHFVLKELNSIKFKHETEPIDRKSYEYESNISFKDTDYIKKAEEIIREFSYLEKENPHEIPEFLRDHGQMVQNFVELEENILKLVDSNENYEKECDKLSIENQKVLAELEQREQTMIKEREILLLEKAREEKAIRDLYKTSHGEGANSQILDSLRDLYCISIYGEDFEAVNVNRRRTKSLLDIDELMETLRKTEFKVIRYIDKLEELADEDEDKFKKIISSRKEYNKFRKQEDQKKKSLAVEGKKKEKAEERMHRVIVKGRNPMLHFNLKASNTSQKVNYISQDSTSSKPSNPLNTNTKINMSSLEEALPKSSNSMKYLFICGSTLSSVGKGSTMSGLGALFQACGLRVTCVKVDPYLNIDAGTMSPYEHGEVFVLDDGGEVDLDLGNYERSLRTTFTKDHNITSGKVFANVINSERKGDYLGKTVQIVPHVTDKIKEMIAHAANQSVEKETNLPADICLVEVGGTVGDLESSMFYEAIRQFIFDVGSENCAIVLVSYVPELGPAHEQKTKPAQFGIKELKSMGLFPNFVVCRSTHRLDDGAVKKIASSANLSPKHVISCFDVVSIWDVPILLAAQNLHFNIMESLKLQPRDYKIHKWLRLSEHIRKLKNATELKIAVCGKYITTTDTYYSVMKSLQDAAFSANRKLVIEWMDCSVFDNVESEEEKAKVQKFWTTLESCQGILVPGGFGKRGVEGMIKVCNYARENLIPYFGICLGMQIAVVEFCRNVINYPTANSKEFDESTKHDVITTMDDVSYEHLGGTLRKGAKITSIKDAESLAFKIYGKHEVVERHRHRYEVNPKYIKEMEEKGLIFSGKDPNSERMNTLEIPTHPFFFGSQYHPEFKTNPFEPTPIFYSFVLASSKQYNKLRNYFEDHVPGISSVIDSNEEITSSDETFKFMISDILKNDKGFKQVVAENKSAVKEQLVKECEDEFSDDADTNLDV